MAGRAFCLRDARGLAVLAWLDDTFAREVAVVARILSRFQCVPSRFAHIWFLFHRVRRGWMWFTREVALCIIAQIGLGCNHYLVKLRWTYTLSFQLGLAVDIIFQNQVGCGHYSYLEFDL